MCLSAVSKAELIPGELTTAYKSALVQGRAVPVQDPEEKLYALKLLVQALDPVSMSRAVLCAEHSSAAHHAGKDRPRDRHRQGVLRRLNKQLSA